MSGSRVVIIRRSLMVGISLALAIEAWRLYAVATRPAASQEGISFISMILGVIAGFPTNLLTVALIDALLPVPLYGFDPQYLLLVGVVLNAILLGWSYTHLRFAPQREAG